MQWDKILIVGLAVLLKLAISLPFINSFPIDLDEPFSIFHAQKSLPELMNLFSTENNPPLHFIMLHFWENLFGIDSSAVRSLSLFFSVLTMPILFSLGRKFLTVFGSVILLVLFIFSDFHHFHGLEARTYSLLIFLFTSSLYCLSTIILDKRYTYQNFILLAFLNILLFYTHYISIFIFLAEALILLVYFRKEHIKKYLASLILFSLVVAPWVSVLFNRSETIKNNGTWIEKAQFSELYGLMNKFLNDKWSMLILLICLTLLFLLNRKIFLKNILKEKQKFLFLLLLGLIPYIATFLMSRFFDINLFYDRYLFFVSIPIFILIIYFFDRDDLKVRMLLGLFVLTFLVRFDIHPDNNRDGDKIAKFVHTLPESVILIAPDYYDLTFIYHFDKELFKKYELVESESVNKIHPLGSKNSLEKLIAENDKLILVNANIEFTQPENTLIDDLNSDFELKSIQKFKGDYSVSFWEKKINVEPAP